MYDLYFIDQALRDLALVTFGSTVEDLADDLADGPAPLEVAAAVLRLLYNLM